MPRGTHRHLVKEEPPAKHPRLRRLHSPLWWVLTLFLAIGGYFTWREYDYRQAVSEAKAAGVTWKITSTGERILELQLNPNAIFREHGDYDEPGCEFKLSRDLIHRLRPTCLRIASCENLDALRGYTGLRTLIVTNCDNVEALSGLKGLQELLLIGCPIPSEDVLKSLSGLHVLSLYKCGIEDADRLKSLTNLRELCLDRCRFLKNLDGLRYLTKLQTLSFSHDSMENIDVLKELTALRELDLTQCVSIPGRALHELRAALQNTDITFPDGSKNPPK